MAWIELHQAVWTHRKTYVLADALDLDETYAAAHVIRLWTWALDNAAEGVISNTSDRVLARAAGWHGDAQAFVQALVAAGWLDRRPDGGYAVHDWYEYAGKWIEKRKANAERMRDARATRSHAPAPERATQVQRTTDARAGATGPNRTGPDLTGPDRTGDEGRARAAPAAAAHGPPESIQGFHAVLSALSGYEPSEAFYAKVEAKYGHLDLEEEALKIAGWLASRPKERCSTRFVLNWLTKALKDSQTAAAAERSNGTYGPSRARNGFSPRHV